jgi:hypothetical protein
VRDAGNILAYASPRGAATPDLPGGDFSLTFAPPPPRVEFAVNAAGAFIAAALAAPSLWVATKLGMTWGLLAATVPALAALFLIVIVCRRAQVIARLLRFGPLPITIAIHNGSVHLSDPAQWGLTMRVYDVDTIVRCHAEFGGWSIGARLYNINIVRTQAETIEMRIAAQNRDVLTRQLADLQNALEAARSAKLPAPDKPPAEP